MLPQAIDYKDFAAQGRVLEGSLPISGFDRVQDLVLNPAELVAFKLTFHKDQRGRMVVDTQLQATVALVCQRCGEPVKVDLNLSSTLSLVSDDQAAKALPKAYDPFMVSGDELQPLDIIEEELLLGLPMAPRHASLTCAGESADYLK